ncbi:putative phage abortive infection protein [Pseudoalteromonas sp. Of11M-6]|uniref:putative phage abortive infection protein n=1 Tax=Pseudoalteromonas sp. Of11M-6 TaxID=2917754 RepID=UPI001EF66E48|nr:putative phage abortive infection protein [Pseudoalteromonas sp. Of11M-6]MCG7552110.1 putative phage abortive infection protein [Pseudoalteromonas sp. Of11M-6]
MKRLSYLIFGLAFAVACIMVGLYINKFGFGFAKTISDWGAVGDFFGGVLNPTFALLSLILIAYTLVQNQKALAQSEKTIAQGQEAIKQNEQALRVSNEELKLTRDELASSSKALEEQAKLLAVQSFETTFFNMLELHSKILNDIYYCPDADREYLKSRIVPDDYPFEQNKRFGMYSLKAINTALEKGAEAAKAPIDVLFRTFNKKHEYLFASYFRNLYETLNFIRSSLLEEGKQKTYGNILRAQLSNDELALLLLYCECHKKHTSQFRELIIDFELFEHLNCTFDGPSYIYTRAPSFKLTTKMLNNYFVIENDIVTKSAFGNNSGAKEFVESVLTNS